MIYTRVHNKDKFSKWIHVLWNWIKNFQNLSLMTKLRYDQTSCLEQDTMTVPFLFQMTKYVFFPHETTRLRVFFNWGKTVFELLKVHWHWTKLLQYVLFVFVNMHHQAASPSVKTSQMASSRNFFLRWVRLTNIKDALTRFPLRFEWRFHRSLCCKGSKTMNKQLFERMNFD